MSAPVSGAFSMKRWTITGTVITLRMTGAAKRCEMC
jgi:hypothetical protein